MVKQAATSGPCALPMTVTIKGMKMNTGSRPGDILAGKKKWQKMPEGEAQCEGTSQQVEDHKSEEDLCGQVFSGASASPKGPPLMG